jgi:hypothetical protein
MAPIIVATHVPQPDSGPGAPGPPIADSRYVECHSTEKLCRASTRRKWNRYASVIASAPYAKKAEIVSRRRAKTDDEAKTRAFEYDENEISAGDGVRAIARGKTYMTGKSRT